jgi:hypothetical protein
MRFACFPLIDSILDQPVYTDYALFQGVLPENSSLASIAMAPLLRIPTSSAMLSLALQLPY